MVNKVIEINLDLKKVVAQNTQIPPLVVGDNGNKFIITLTDDGAPVNLEDTKVLFVVSKTSDGTTVEQDTEDAIVDMTEYGVSYTGTPVEDDKITVVLAGDSAVATHSGTGIQTASVDPPTFKAKVVNDGTYVFEFNGDDWQLGENSVIISGTNHNIVTIHLRTSSFGSGKNNCELQVYSGDDRDVLVTTAQFNFDGRPGIINDETIKTEDKYPLLTQLINTVTKLYEALKTWIGVTASATRTEGSVSVSLTEVSGHKNFSFQIPTDVHIGTSAPTGQQSVWIKPDGVASEYVPTSRKINGYDLTQDRTLDADDIPTDTQNVSVQDKLDSLDGDIDNLQEAERIGTVATLTANWTAVSGAEDVYSQTPTITVSPVTTAKTKVDLQINYTQIQQLVEDGTTALYVENNNNVFTVYCVGEHPTVNMTFQAQFTEVE